MTIRALRRNSGHGSPLFLSGGALMPPLDLGLFYFASSEGGPDARDGYRLMLESAAFADRGGFASLWMPERHFHAFGGLSPNPALLASALATRTERIRLRAGSVVVPLHHPARIVEEWSVVDQLSGGRVELGVAAGWFPDDFVFASPEAYRNRHALLAERVVTLRSLWAGESFPGINGVGDRVHVRTLPRPIQPHLPLWLTAAMAPETFRQAGTLGTHVLTHLLFQGVDALEARIREYREAWASAGHPGEGRVAVMLHTHVTESAEGLHARVRGPMKQYLGSSVSLAHRYLQSLPVFRDQPELRAEALTPGQVDEALEYSFERYFRTRGLFGTPEDALPVLDRLQAIGVDEVACLIDFGMPVDEVLSALPALARLRALHLASPGRTPRVAALAEVTARDTGNDAGGGPSTPVGEGARALEAVLVELWSGLLDLPDPKALDVRANLFELGVHSLLAVQAVDALQRRTGQPVEILDLFRYPSIRALAQHLARTEDAEASDPSTAALDDARARADRRRALLRRPGGSAKLPLGNG